MIHQMMLLLHLEMNLRQQALTSYTQTHDPVGRLARLDEVLALNEQLNEVGPIAIHVIILLSIYTHIHLFQIFKLKNSFLELPHSSQPTLIIPQKNCPSTGTFVFARTEILAE